MAPLLNALLLQRLGPRYRKPVFKTYISAKCHLLLSFQYYSFNELDRRLSSLSFS